MSAYLFPNLKSKKAYREAIAKGEKIQAVDMGVVGGGTIENGKMAFEGPHYPEPHKFYGVATIKNGFVEKIN